MKTIKLSSASRTLAEYAAEFSKEIVLLTERDKPVAAIVPLRGVARESIALSAHPDFLRIINRSRAQFRRRQTMSLADMKAVFDTVPAKTPNAEPDDLKRVRESRMRQKQTRERQLRKRRASPRPRRRSHT